MITHNSCSSTPGNVQITTRQPQFDFQDTPNVWLSDPIKTHFMNSLSVLIPYSEKTVNEVMRKNLHRFHDPKLQKEIQALIKQEGAHARMHRKTNSLLVEAGFSKVSFFENVQIRLMTLLRKVYSDAFELAMPAAFEHFTAAISRDFLAHPDYWQGNNGNAAIEFSKWHALEEIEHQAVCYDAFNSVYKNKYRLSLHIAFIWLPVFVLSTFIIQLYLLHKDRVIYKPKYWPQYLSFMGRSIKLFSKGILSYSKNDFSSWSPQDEALYDKSLQDFKESSRHP
jgi:predicted metal-dependent hydrolase